MAIVALAASVATAQPAGTYTVLHSFNSATDVIGPGGLIQGTDGNFYGTSSGGPAPSAGTVFRMTPAGVVTILHSFPGGAGGANPVGIMQATDGNFYGVTGPTTNGGTVFKITPSGTVTTLHTFDGTDGFNPVGHLVEGTDGNLYGSTPMARTAASYPTRAYDRLRRRLQADSSRRFHDPPQLHWRE